MTDDGETWVCCRYVELFAEEVVRGGPAFAVSLILSSLEPALRAAAELGAWQIISPVSAAGRVEGGGRPARGPGQGEAGSPAIVTG